MNRIALSREPSVAAEGECYGVATIMFAEEIGMVLVPGRFDVTAWRMRRLPGRQKNKNAFLAAYDDVRDLVAVQVHGGYLDADA
jgi:hypothetical protein